MKKRNVYWIDLFCGAGGVSLGIQKAGQTVLACINHDKNAILSHAANHPNVMHFEEDIRTIPLSPIVQAVQDVREKDKTAIICLWASLECTNYSKAKGGQSRDADSRTLANHLFRYLDAINFDYIGIENVEEFMSWGPLCAKTEKVKTDNGTVEVCPIRYDSKTKKMQPTWIPESKTQGSDYVRWVSKICKDYGFTHDHRILNCADFGDPTRRHRYFGIFAKKGSRITFPQPTHQNPTKLKVRDNGTLFNTDNLKAWRPVKECLNFKDVGESIFGRKKPLVEKTLRRIYAGLVKFVMSNEKEYEKFIHELVKSLPMEDVVMPISLENSKQPQPFINKYMSNSPQTGISVPQSIDNPCPTVTTQGRMTLVQAFLASSYSSPNFEADKSKVTSLDMPCPTLTTIPHQSIFFLDKYYGNSVAASVELPANTVTTVDRFGLVHCEKYSILSPTFDANTSTFDYGLKKESSDKIKIEPQMFIRIFASDSEYTKKIKVCMSLFGLIDIKMRMLRIEELKLIQSFPKDYTLLGTMVEQKKYIGNAVPSETVKSLVSCIG